MWLKVNTRAEQDAFFKYVPNEEKDKKRISRREKWDFATRVLLRFIIIIAIVIVLATFIVSKLHDMRYITAIVQREDDIDVVVRVIDTWKNEVRTYFCHSGQKWEAWKRTFAIID